MAGWGRGPGTLSSGSGRRPGLVGFANAVGRRARLHTQPRPAGGWRLGYVRRISRATEGRDHLVEQAAVSRTGRVAPLLVYVVAVLVGSSRFTAMNGVIVPGLPMGGRRRRAVLDRMHQGRALRVQQQGQHRPPEAAPAM